MTTVADFEFTDGFDAIGPVGIYTGFPGTAPAFMTGEGAWTNYTGGGCALSVIASLVGPGYAMRLNTGGNASSLAKSLPGNYARHIGGIVFRSALTNGWGNICFCMLADGTLSQIKFLVDVLGRITCYRGGTVIAVSTIAVASNSINFFEWDVTFHASAGRVTLWMNGLPTGIDFTGNTMSTAHAYANTFMMSPGDQGSTGVTADFDHLYMRCWLVGGSDDLPWLDNSIVDTEFPTADYSIMFAPTAGVLGYDYTNTNTVAPGANRLSIMTYTPEVDCTLNSIGIKPRATSVTAKFKGAVYDNAGNLLSSGTEVIGCTSGTELVLPLVTPQALTAGTPYRLAYINNTDITLDIAFNDTIGVGAANTYTAGAPATLPALTSNLPTWRLWGNCVTMAHNYSQVNENPPSDLHSYNTSSVVNDEDLFYFTGLRTTPDEIHTMGVKVRGSKTDSGARTLDITTLSGATHSAGSTTGIAPTTSPTTMASYWPNDPNTGVPWEPADLDAAKSGYKNAA